MPKIPAIKIENSQPSGKRPLTCMNPCAQLAVCEWNPVEEDGLELPEDNAKIMCLPKKCPAVQEV